MLRKRLGLSTEPQPVFVGASFALLMLLMHVYTISITEKGEIMAMLNNPRTLLGTMMNMGSKINFAVWLIKALVPILIIICAAAYGKKRAKLLFVPCLPTLFYAVSCIIGGTFISYHISYFVYFLTIVFFTLVSIKVIKSVKPFIVYCILVCIAVVVLTALKQPPFTLFDGSIYLSDMLYFIIYHITLINFARAVPMQQ